MLLVFIYSGCYRWLHIDLNSIGQDGKWLPESSIIDEFVSFDGGHSYELLYIFSHVDVVRNDQPNTTGHQNLVLCRQSRFRMTGLTCTSGCVKWFKLKQDSSEQWATIKCISSDVSSGMQGNKGREISMQLINTIFACGISSDTRAATLILMVILMRHDRGGIKESMIYRMVSADRWATNHGLKARIKPRTLMDPLLGSLAISAESKPSC